MKYKVSLLPEKNRKRIIGRKKAVKAKSVALIILLILLANVLLLTVCYTYAQSKKAEIVALNDEYAKKVEALQQYRDINTELQNKISLIKSIQVNEPSLANFLSKISNIDHPGVSVSKIDCTDWKTTRACTITGRVDSRATFNKYMESLQDVKGISSVSCSSYTVSMENGESVADFTIAITCEGGTSVVVAETTPETTQAAE